jgi:DNA (cytosine-5)-methyltransferase 1
MPEDDRRYRALERPTLSTNDKHRRPTVVALFARVDGLSLGFEAVGFDVAASVEIDPIHCAVHYFNFPYATTV